MTLRIYSTLCRELERFVPRDPGRATVYCCGPTVYDVPHIGHARAAVVFDVLVRHLRQSGLEVTYVRNVTDVDDKILDRARQQGEPPLELSRRMTRIYQEQMQALGCLAPDHEPRVSEHLPEVIALILRLLEQGAAYVQPMPSGTQDVYFSVRSFRDYGKLSRRRLEDLRVGARVAPDESKHDPLDFALWKGALPDEWGWESPWGRGRPGWHIECSAMSLKYLGYGFDIHGGGMDLIFPHHENEIAQSEAAHPGQGPCVRYWMHNGFVNLSRAGSGQDSEKMSKSLGNVVTVAQVLERNDPEALRWLLLAAHYRGPIQFEVAQDQQGRLVFPGVDEAEGRVDYLYGAVRRLQEIAQCARPCESGQAGKELVELERAAQSALDEARAALDEDLNTPVALSALTELARLGNELAQRADKRRVDQAFLAGAGVAAAGLLRAIEQLAAELGLLLAPVSTYLDRTRARRLSQRGLSPEQVEAKLAQRAEARRRRDYARADALRQELEMLGIAVRDTPAGTEWSVRP